MLKKIITADEIIEFDFSSGLLKDLYKLYYFYQSRTDKYGPACKEFLKTRIHHTIKQLNTLKKYQDLTEIDLIYHFAHKKPTKEFIRELDLFQEQVDVLDKRLSEKKTK